MNKGKRRARIAFLFNHDAAHQIAHGAGVLREYALANPDQDVVAMVRDAAIASIVREMVGEEACARIIWYELSLPALHRVLLAPLNSVAPVYRIARLRRHLAAFAQCDVIVSTERTCLWVKRRLGANAPQFVFIPHGAGDRNVSYHPELARFDLFLLSGQKVIDEMVRHGIARAEQCRLIGYPKFDMIERNAKPRFFDNDRPVFLYNPHFDPHLSSWYDEGLTILEYFRANAERFNLILAPHVMLFRKKLHYSLEYRTARMRPDIPAIYYNCSNIHIDTDSSRLFDMSYTLSADAYIGDVSSQVYEFLIHPRACYFIDVHSDAGPLDPPPYEFWRNGPVSRSAAEMLPLIPQWQEVAHSYHAEQQRLFAYTMNDDADTPASLRGARALADFMRERSLVVLQGRDDS